FLSVAKENYLRASFLHKTQIKPFQKIKEKINLDNSQTTKIYDYIESMQVSIIMISTAIESLVNSIIHSNFQYKTENTKKTEIYKYIRIQKKISHSEKLEKVIKQSLNIDVSKKKFWKDYKILYGIRNDLIHMKSKETSSTSDQRNFFDNLDEDIVKRLIDDKSLSYLKAG